MKTITKEGTTQTICSTYDKRGHCIRETHGDGHVTKREFDLRGNLTLEEYPQHRTSYTYDQNGRCTSLAFIDPAFDSEQAEKFTYNLLGEKISSTKNNGKITSTTYDAMDNPIKTFHSTPQTDGTWEDRFTYRTFDHHGNLIEKMTPSGATSYTSTTRITSPPFTIPTAPPKPSYTTFKAMCSPRTATATLHVASPTIPSVILMSTRHNQN